MSTEAFNVIYKNTASESPLRRLAIDECAWAMEPDQILQQISSLPARMIPDLLDVFMKAIPQQVREAKGRRVEWYVYQA